MHINISFDRNIILVEKTHLINISQIIFFLKNSWQDKMLISRWWHTYIFTWTISTLTYIIENFYKTTTKVLKNDCTMKQEIASAQEKC